METTTVRTTERELSEPDEIEQFLADAYETPVSVRGVGGRPLLRHRRHDAGPYAVEAAHQSADLELEIEPLRRIVVTRTSTCRLERSSSKFHGRYDVGELFFLSEPDRSCRARWLPGELQNCLIDPVLLARVAGTAPARRPGPLRFTSLDPQTPADAAHWWATRTYVAALLANPAAAAPLLIANAGQLLAAATLATFPNTAVTDPTAEDRHDAHPGTLRRAIAFIEDHADQDVAAADIAGAAHVSVRAVQLAFRRHLDMTPLQYLRRTRLSQVHDELRKADPAATTVSAVAGRWGFYNQSRFAALYRKTYDITPSQTLRQIQ